MSTRRTVILGTGVLVRAILSPGISSRRVVADCSERRLVPVVSSQTLREYRRGVLGTGLRSRFPEITPGLVGEVIDRLRCVADHDDPSMIHFE